MRINSRIPLLLTTRPRQDIAGTISVVNPSRAPSSASTRTLPAALWPKRKLSPTRTARAPHRIHQQALHEFLRRQHAPLPRVKGRIRTAAIPSSAISRGAALGRRQQRRRALRRDDPRRVRIEGEHGGLPTVFGSDRVHAAQNLPVSEVDAVEIADGDRARPKSAGSSARLR